MVKFTLPFWLADARGGKAGNSVLTTLSLPPGSWEAVMQELRITHPTVAERVFTSSGRMAAGFALVLNDDVVPGGSMPAHLTSGDELFVIATIAGGCPDCA
jgi:sulfur carrier protein ThiS